MNISTQDTKHKDKKTHDVQKIIKGYYTNTMNPKEPAFPLYPPAKVVPTRLSNACLNLLFLCIVAFFTSSCYYITQGYYLVSTNARQKNIERLLKNESLDAETREFLSNSLDIKRFAHETLELKKSNNYTRYTRLDNDYLVVVVHAAPEFSLEAHTWNYPFLGTLSYRGFYREEDAKKEAEALREMGFDTYVRKVSAFSTLGILSDPLYSSLKGYSLKRLSEVIIHEEYHATVWVRKQQNFNEQMATFIGKQGARLYLESKHIAQDDNDTQQAVLQQDQKTMNSVLLALRQELADLYKRTLPAHEMRSLKQSIIERTQLEFMSSYDSTFKTDAYREWDLNNINNAFLSLIHIYRDKDNRIETLYEKSNMSLKEFIHLTKQLEKREYRDNPFQALQDLVRDYKESEL